MTAAPTKLYDAFEKIRLGKIEEGLRLFDRVDGFEPLKSVALAELAYFRHDWKRALLFDRDFFDSSVVVDTTRYKSRIISTLHLELMLVATCQLDAWKETRKYFDQLKKQHEEDITQKNDWYAFLYDLPKYISLVSDPANTARLLTETRPKKREEGKETFDNLESYLSRAKRGKKQFMTSYYAELVHKARTQASSKDHALFYEKYADELTSAKDHSEAAKTFIALDEPNKAKDALRRYMEYWKYKESVQVAPIVLFTEYELWPILSERRFTESLLAIPHNNEA